MFKTRAEQLKLLKEYLDEVSAHIHTRLDDFGISGFYFL